MKATVDIPMAYDYEDEKVFIVQSLLDLNEVQGLPLVSVYENIFISSKPLHLPEVVVVLKAYNE